MSQIQKNSFRDYYNSKTQPPADPVSWDVVLFTGEYNPISKEEYHRINCFVNNYIRPNSEKFKESVDIGLLTSSESLSEINTNLKYELTFDERQFLTGKLFGLKMFPVDMKELFSLAHFDKEDRKNNTVKIVSSILKENFNSSNILIVLREDESTFMNEIKEISHVFSENNMNVGFVVYKHKPLVKDEFFKKINIDGRSIKACCLLDSIRPDPLELKNFAYKYNLQDTLDTIKLMHFKTGNEKYQLVFEYLFPKVKLHNIKSDEEIYDSQTLLELVKKMYTYKDN
jgi:hypothetical protein